jgi:hypothetical protein
MIDEDRCVKRFLGGRSNSGCTVYVPTVDVKDWQVEKIIPFVVGYLTEPYKGRTVFIFEVNKEEKDVFRFVAEMEDIFLI